MGLSQRVRAILMSVLLIVVLGALVVWRANGRGPAQTGVAQGTVADAAAARRWLDGVKFSYSKPGSIDDLLKNTQAIVQIRVESVEFPIWNSASGHAWDGNTDVAPDVYSRISATVESEWYGDAPEGAIELLVIGDATERFESDTTPTWAQLSGGFAVGDSYVVLLKRRIFEFESASREGWTLAVNFEGNWRISGGSAIGSDTRRSLTLSALRSTLGEAWTRRNQ